MKTTTLKTKTMSLLLAIVMLLGMMPISAFAADTTVQVTVDEEGLIEADSNGALPDGVSVVGGGYLLASNREYAFSGGTVLWGVVNHGTILLGSFGWVRNAGTISDGTFNGLVTNTGTISGGTFNGKILNMGGTIADGVNATVAQGGDLALVKQTLGTGSITVKQNAIDIPSGKAGEVYNVAGFDPATLVGLYLLGEGETVPTENFSIDTTVFTPVEIFGQLVQYNFTMPNEAVTIVAVFDDYETETTEVNFFTYIIEGTDAENLENPQYLGDSLYEIDSLYSFTEDTVLPGDIVPGFIPYENNRYDFAGFILSEYDEATDTFSYSLSQTLTIPAEPAYGTAAWEEWKASVPEGLNAAYMLHTHSYVTKSDDSGHWEECSCGDNTTVQPHTYSSDTDTTCDCGYTRTIEHDHSWGSWTSNNDGTHTRTCAADTSHTETADCSDSNDDGELCDTCGYDLHEHSYTPNYDTTNHWNECSCDDKQNAEKHKFTYTFFNNFQHTIGCEGCGYRLDVDHMGGTNHNYNDGGHWLDCSECKGKVHYGIHTYDDKYDRYCNGLILYNSGGEYIGTDACKYDKHAFCASDGKDPFGPYSITDTAHERTCTKCGLTVREDHTANTYSWIDAAAHSEVCVCGKSLGAAAHTWMPASTHSSICTECSYYLDNHTYTAFKPSEANPETYHVLYCSVCGEMSDPVQVAGHNYEVKYDKYGHWNLCTDCGYTTAKTAHQMTVSRYDGTSLVHINSCSGCEHDEYENCDFKQGTYDGNEDGHWAVCFACGRTHSGIPLQAHVDENADGTCDVCKEKYTPPHTHSYKDKYDSTGHWTECDCGEKTAVKAHSYTGMFDSTCDCGYDRGLFKVGTVDTDYVDVGFIPSEDVTLPADAELVVEDHYPSLAPIASFLGQTAGTEYVDIPVNNISRLEDKADSYMPGGYMIGEIIVIDGEKYVVCEGVAVLVHLIRLSDNAKFTYNVEYSTLFPDSTTYDAEIQTNRTIVINGARYDVPETITHNGIEQYAVLYVDGVPAGLYIPSENSASFCEGYDPETLKAQQDDSDLGSVTIPTDYNDAAIADFAPGKTYNVSVIGSNDISIEGLTDVNGTVTQTFKIPDALVGAKNVKYVAVHDTTPHAAQLATSKYFLENDPGEEKWQLAYENDKRLYDAWEEENGSGAEFGTVTFSLDGLTLTATHTGVKGFSPFIVYAFVEADEPEYKELSATLHTEHTYEKGKCTVCEAVDPDYVPETPDAPDVPETPDIPDAPETTDKPEVPQTGDNSHMALWIALLLLSGGAVLTLTAYDRRRRKTV